jgi:hypothetical protein
MNSRQMIDWTTPHAYLRDIAPPSRWQRLLRTIDRLLAESNAAALRRREARVLRRLRAASHEIPPYLRRDIGLPPG